MIAGLQPLSDQVKMHCVTFVICFQWLCKAHLHVSFQLVLAETIVQV